LSLYYVCCDTQRIYYNFIFQLIFCLISVLDTLNSAFHFCIRYCCRKSTSSSAAAAPLSGVHILLRPVTGVLNMHHWNDDRQAQFNEQIRPVCTTLCPTRTSVKLNSGPYEGKTISNTGQWHGLLFRAINRCLLACLKVW
jgi:hypothetical protein